MLASNKLIESLINVGRTLNNHHVDYLIVGGTAVAYYGYFRHSITMAGVPADRPDVDIWYNSSYSNYFKLLDALADLGQDIRKYKNEQSPNPRKSFFKYEFEYFTLDLLPEIKAALSFGVAFSRKEIIELDGVAIPFIDFEDLIADKEAAARPKDFLDIQHLRNASNQKPDL
jgi:predicted nucleotidyltransferase